MSSKLTTLVLLLLLMVGCVLLGVQLRLSHTVAHDAELEARVRDSEVALVRTDGQLADAKKQLEILESGRRRADKQSADASARLDGLEPALEKASKQLSDVTASVADHKTEIGSLNVRLHAVARVRRFEVADKVWMEFRWIPKGIATLGSPENEEGRYTDEEEDEYKEKTGFWLGKYSVTQAEWTAVDGKNPSYFVPTQPGMQAAKIIDTSRFPVESVSFDDLYGQGWKGGDAPKEGSFFAKLNAREGMAEAFGKGAKFRLPNENQWEYAYRGGLGNKRAYYWGDALNGDVANCDGIFEREAVEKGEYLASTSQVGEYELKAPHPWGLCDMSGNVYQWCETERTTSQCVARGGCHYDTARDCRAAFRHYAKPSDYSKLCSYGFRVCVAFD